MDGVVAAVAGAGFEAVELAAGVEAEVVAVLGISRAGAGCDVAVVEVAEGVVRGGAVIVEAVLTTVSRRGVSRPVGGASRTISFIFPLPVEAGPTTCSAERGGASRSSSRAAGGVPLAGLIKPAGLVLRDLRLSRGFSSVGLAKLNSPGSELGSFFVAGIELSGMTY